LVEQRKELGGIRVFLGSSYCEAIQPDHADWIRFIGIGAVGRTKKFYDAGALEIIPCHLTDIPRLMQDGRLQIDVVLLQASENSAGELSYGLVSSYLTTAVEGARAVVAEINDHTPWTCSTTPLKRDQVHYTVRTSRPLQELPVRPPTPSDVRIAERVAGLIEDGDILQIGIGTLPDAILTSLSDRKNLGIHSGIISDGVADLIQSGVVTNATKTVDRGITVTGGLFGSRKLYELAHCNPSIRVDPVVYTHSTSILGSFDAFVTINAAIEVDLTGQVNGEVANGAYLGIVGGQTDFSRAAAQCSRGRSIVVVPSRTGRGVNRIVDRLSQGVVSAARADADIIVSEYGIAHLRGCSISERARRMIAIAHPDDRAALEAAARNIPGAVGL